MKFTSYDALLAAHPDHPVVEHAQFCLGHMCYPNTILRVMQAALDYFNFNGRL